MMYPAREVAGGKCCGLIKSPAIPPKHILKDGNISQNLQNLTSFILKGAAKKCVLSDNPSISFEAKDLF